MSEHEPKKRSLTRRVLLGGAAVLGVGAVAGGGFLMTVRPRTAGERVGNASMFPGAGVPINAWLRIEADGTVTFAAPRAEIGQGIHTGMAQLVADELDADWSKVKVEPPPQHAVYGNVALPLKTVPYRSDVEAWGKEFGKWLAGVGSRQGVMTTGGSTGIIDGWMACRTAGASARDMLVRAAAARWAVAPSTCTTDNGRVVHAASGSSIGYGEIAGEAARLLPPDAPRLKTASQFKLIGKPLRRLDTGEKVTGKAVFGTDPRMPGMLHAAVLMSPVIAGKIATLDDSKARGQLGVVGVFRLPSIAGSSEGIAVVADKSWTARKALDAVSVTWAPGPAGRLSSDTVRSELRSALSATDAKVWHETGNVVAARGQAKQQLEAVYETPYLAHACLEPLCATALVQPDRVTVWASTQAPTISRRFVAETAGIAESAVTLIPTLVGGGFGRKGAPEPVVQSVVLAKAFPGRAVQVVWTRETDMTQDAYRPAAAIGFNAGLDAQGQIACHEARVASDSPFVATMSRIAPPAIARLIPDKTAAEGIWDRPYRIANDKVDHVARNHGVPVTFWRSVGHTSNTFGSECFIDEMAVAGGRDPLILRRELLAHAPRQLRVLDAVAQAAGWGQSLPSGKARGIAFVECYGSITAMTAEISLIAARKIRIDRVICAVDCGMVVNPDLVKQQIEGGFVFGLSALMHGEITIKNGEVQEKNFDSYDMARLAQVPAVETIILPSSESPGGTGEVSTPLVAPAVCNAIAALTGQRIRSLPVKAFQLV